MGGSHHSGGARGNRFALGRANSTIIVPLHEKKDLLRRVKSASASLYTKVQAKLANTPNANLNIQAVLDAIAAAGVEHDSDDEGDPIQPAYAAHRRRQCVRVVEALCAARLGPI